MNPVAPSVSTAMVQAVGMRGFAAEFRDLDHYIRVITDRIWEGGRIDDIRTYYGDPCVVETPAAVSTSVQEVIDGTRATLAMFPDRRLLAEDIIQSGDDVGGYLSSHRIISTMTHRGDGVFGKASGRRVHARTIADCVCKGNRVVHEWLVRDQGAIALQVGLTPRTLARSDLSITRLSAGRVRVTLNANTRGAGADIWLVAYDPGPLAVVVHGGLNINRTVLHYNLVRSVERLDAWSGRAVWYERARCTPECAVIVQSPNGGPILGAAYTGRR